MQALQPLGPSRKELGRLDSQKEPVGLRTHQMAATALQNRPLLEGLVQDASLADLPSESDLRNSMKSESEVSILSAGS